jgi:choline dehydrogenase-like flavoprotein
MKALAHLMYMGTHGHVVDNGRESLVTPNNLQRLQGLPILFISGSENVVYKPQNTDKSYTVLTTKFGYGNYDRKVFDDYGHLDCWMGAEAAKDVYPYVLAHANKFSKPTTGPTANAGN